MSRLADADILERVCASLGDENEFSDVEFDDEWEVPDWDVSEVFDCSCFIHFDV